MAAGPRAALAAAGSGPDRNVGVLCAALGALGFSFKSVLIKGAYRYGVDAETLLCLRMAYALPWLLLMTFAQQRREPLKLSRRDWFEFAVLGVECDPAMSHRLVDRLKAALAEADIAASVGLAAHVPASGLQQAWQQADREMYRAKTGGRS